MTKIAIVPNAAGTGTFTIEAPNSNSNRTLLLPDLAGTVLTDVSSLATTNFPAGTVIQVVQNATAIGTVNTTSTSYVDLTNATATITPRGTFSRILVLWTSRASNTLVTGANVQYFHRVLRGATEITQTSIAAESGTGGLQIQGAQAMSVLDSPSTTSAVTYKIQHRTSNASSTGTANGGFLTLLEIAG